jgi:hypothetical protein
MTTTVHIEVANPNHKRVRMRVVTPASKDPNVPLTEGHVLKDEILEPGDKRTEYVHGGARLVFDEVD